MALPPQGSFWRFSSLTRRLLPGLSLPVAGGPVLAGLARTLLLPDGRLCAVGGAASTVPRSGLLPIFPLETKSRSLTIPLPNGRTPSGPMRLPLMVGLASSVTLGLPGLGLPSGNTAFSGALPS